MDRRHFCQCALAGSAIALAGPRPLWAGEARELAFYHTHTGERLELRYHDGVSYLPDALARLDRFLRDFRTGEVQPIDPELLDILAELRAAVGASGAYEVISGFRSAQTNEMLRRRGGVAERSLHLEGRALDVRLVGVETARLRDAAISLQRGGVGYYAASDFVHIDTGRVRRW